MSAKKEIDKQGLFKVLEESIRRIAKERDELERLIDDTRSILDSTEEALEALESARDILSEYL